MQICKPATYHLAKTAFSAVWGIQNCELNRMWQIGVMDKALDCVPKGTLQFESQSGKMRNP